MSRAPSRPRFLAGVAVIAAAAAMLLIPAQQATAKAVPGCAAGGVKVNSGARPATVSVTDTTTGSAVQVVVTVTGTTFTITTVGGGVTLTGATWCLKASTKTQTGTSTTGASTITNRKGVAQAIGYVAVYSVTSQPADPLAATRATCEGEPSPGTFTVFGPPSLLGTVWACVMLSGFDPEGAKAQTLKNECYALGPGFAWTIPASILYIECARLS